MLFLLWATLIYYIILEFPRVKQDVSQYLEIHNLAEDTAGLLSLKGEGQIAEQVLTQAWFAVRLPLSFYVHQHRLGVKRGTTDSPDPCNLNICRSPCAIEVNWLFFFVCLFCFLCILFGFSSDSVGSSECICPFGVSLEIGSCHSFGHRL